MICSSQSQSSTTISSDSLLRAPVQRYRVPKRIPTFLDLNQKPKKEKFAEEFGKEEKHSPKKRENARSAATDKQP